MNAERYEEQKRVETKESGETPMLGGHQPVLDFHTGLLAKINLSKVWIVHDLDSLAENGSTAVSTPTQQGKVIQTNLYRGIERANLFLTSAEYLGIENAGLSDKLISFLKPLGLINRRRIKEIKERASLLDSKFPPGVVNVAQRNTQLLQFVLPDLGITGEKSFLYLSEILCEENIKVLLSEILNEGVGGENFWAWENYQRRSIRDVELSSLLEQGRLIPKAITLSLLFHKIAEKKGWGIVGGLGQESYEAKAKLNGTVFPDIKRVTVTSLQGLTENFLTNANGESYVVLQSLKEKKYRPSAIIMWLLGIKFNPDNIVYSQGQNTL